MNRILNRSSVRTLARLIPVRGQIQFNRSFFGSGSSSSTTIVPELLSSSLPSLDLSYFPLLLAAVLASTESEEDELHKQPWVVKDCLDRGLGAESSRDLKKGELLIAERPICIWPQGLSESKAQILFDQMSPLQQKIYMNLAQNEIPNLDPIRRVRATNGFAIQLPDNSVDNNAVVAMVFPKISRINHQCCPNASQAMNFKTLRMEVYAIKDIKKGEEIFIEYIPNLITQTRSERQLSLKTAFGFNSCLCSICSSPAEEVAKSDERRREIKSLGNTLINSNKNNRKGTLANLERIRILLKEENYSGLPEFDDQALSNAYAVYISLHSRGQLPQV